MALNDIKITELGNRATPHADSVIPLVDGADGQNYRATLAAIRGAMGLDAALGTINAFLGRIEDMAEMGVIPVLVGFSARTGDHYTLTRNAISPGATVHNVTTGTMLLMRLPVINAGPITFEFEGGQYNLFNGDNQPFTGGEFTANSIVTFKLITAPAGGNPGTARLMQGSVDPARAVGPLLAAKLDLADWMGAIVGREIAGGGSSLMEDVNGNVLLAARTTGLDFMPSDELRNRLGAGATAPDWAPLNAIRYWVTNDGHRHYLVAGANGLIEQFDSIAPAHTSFIMNNDIEALPTTGQSLSVGGPWNGYIPPDITDTTLKLAGITSASLRGWLSAANPGNDPISGFDKATYPANVTTMTIPMCDTISKHRQLVSQPRRSMVGFSFGYSGASIAQISNGTAPFTNFQYWYQQAYDAADDLGLTLRTKWLGFDQGTADASMAKGTYRTRLDTLHSDMMNYLVGLGGRDAENFQFVMSQASGFNNTTGSAWGVCNAQLEFCQDGNGILACPLYPVKIQPGNNVHPDGFETMIYSEYFAKAIAEVEAGFSWPTAGPLYVFAEHPIETPSGSVTIDFDLRHDEALVFDDSGKYGGVGVDNYGFEIPGRTITAVTLQDHRTVRIDYTGGSQATEVRYAMQRQDVSGGGNIYTAHRGLLRTTYGFPSYYDPGRTLHRWVPSFTRAVN